MYLIHGIIYAVIDFICLMYYSGLDHLFKLLQYFRAILNNFSVHLLWCEYTIGFPELSDWISIQFMHSVFISMSIEYFFNPIVIISCFQFL